MSIHGTDTSLITRLLASTAQRADVIADNVANSSTPGYVRRSLQFENLLGNALQHGRDTDGIEPVTVEDLRTPKRPDGNNVIPELELTAHRTNKLLYDTYVSVLSAHFRMLEASISAGR